MKTRIMKVLATLLVGAAAVDPANQFDACEPSADTICQLTANTENGSQLFYMGGDCCMDNSVDTMNGQFYAAETGNCYNLQNKPRSDLSFVTTMLLTWLLGVYGCGRCYRGGHICCNTCCCIGFLKGFTLGGVALFYIVDFWGTLLHGDPWMVDECGNRMCHWTPSDCISAFEVDKETCGNNPGTYQEALAIYSDSGWQPVGQAPQLCGRASDPMSAIPTPYNVWRDTPKYMWAMGAAQTILMLLVQQFVFVYALPYLKNKVIGETPLSKLPWTDRKAMMNFIAERKQAIFNSEEVVEPAETA